ncbi:MAG TPA: gamma-glutamylcyclotransferase family protein [Solirubrobacteraceae bacterium]|nr:gamma-glutamylcyclotransferase family protein [Solirubrobacteraceae bacterium]
MNVRKAEFVFGYGSLTARPSPVPTRELKEHGFIADLAGLRRVWGVAMDNRRDLAGYKYYTDATGRRPEVFVAYLDLVAAPDDPATGVNGLCLPVDGATLAVLDRRERNYERVDVSDRLAPGGPGVDGIRVWAYLGSAAARERFAAGREAGTAVIEAGYVRTVEAGFAALGAEEHSACRPSLRPGGLPVLELTRHELPWGPRGRPAAPSEPPEPGDRPR